MTGKAVEANVDVKVKPKIVKKSDANMLNRFCPQLTSDSQNQKIDKLRNMYINLADHIEKHMPDNRCRSIALTELESSCHWAIKSITHDKIYKGE